METAQVTEPSKDLAEVDSPVKSIVAAEAFRASMEAVRSAQAVARSRARTETRWARLVAGGALLAVGATAWAASHRPSKANPVAPASKVVALATPAVAAPQPAIAPPPREAPPAEVAPKPVAAVAADAGRHAAWCDAAFEQRNWTAIAATCAPAFAARPGESAFALRVAQAEHRRGHVAIAADWARKALAVDKDLAEAYVLVARAEKDAGHAGATTDAYRRYLELAPRGWHAREAHRALRAAR
jgi:hypothetical protein